MASLNKAHLIGRLGKDPDVRATSKGETVVSFSFATDSGYGDKKTTEWHKVVCFGKPADFIKNYIKKGDPLYLEGTIVYREYVDKSGIKRRVTEIKAYSVQSLGSKPTESSTTYSPGEDQDSDPYIPF